MSKLLILIIVSATAALNAFAASDDQLAQARHEKGSKSEDADDLRIAFSPDAAKKNKRNEQAELYLKARAGDADAKKTWGRMTTSARTAFLAELAKESDESVARTHAIRELSTMSAGEDPDGVSLIALAQIAVTEKDGSLRTLARNGLAARGDDHTPKMLVKALDSPNALFRDNAAAALNAIGGPKVFEVVIEHWKEFWGEGNRGFCYFGEQRAYVADYDINGDSYDPVVRSFMTGVCLDVKSLKIEGDIYYKTIREILPKDVKLDANPAAWEKWLGKERANLASDGELRRRAAREALSEVQDE